MWQWLVPIGLLGASVALAGWCVCKRGGDCDKHLEATRRQIREAKKVEQEWKRVERMLKDKAGQA